MPADFQFQGEAQERSDGHDYGQNTQILQRRLDGDGPDDVGNHQEFEPEQDGAAEIGAQCMVGIGESYTTDHAHGERESCHDRAEE